jgi:hypothetical protein
MMGVTSFVGCGVAVSGCPVTVLMTSTVGVKVGASNVGVRVAGGTPARVRVGASVIIGASPVGEATLAGGSGVGVGVRSGACWVGAGRVGVPSGETTGVLVYRRVAVGGGVVGVAKGFEPPEAGRVNVAEGVREAVAVDEGVFVATPMPADTVPRSETPPLVTSWSR